MAEGKPTPPGTGQALPPAGDLARSGASLPVRPQDQLVVNACWERLSCSGLPWIAGQVGTDTFLEILH